MNSRWATYKSVIETIALVLITAGVVYTAFYERGGGGRSPRAAGAGTVLPPAPLPSEPVSLAGAQTVGDAGAKVALVMYSDFQCPFCARFGRDVLPTLQKQYVDTGRVLLAFRHLPLDIHPFAQKAAEGSLCAGRQGKFWPFHDELFANPTALDERGLQDRAARLSLDTKAFATCLSGEAAAEVAADKKSAGEFGITGTPTFLAGPIVEGGRVKVSERFSGALPIQQFQTKLDELLRRAGVRATIP